MALQTSGAISLQNVAAEFGGAVPHSLSEYYGVDSGIPSSGQISLSNFYGAANFPTFTASIVLVGGGGGGGGGFNNDFGGGDGGLVVVPSAVTLSSSTSNNTVFQ